MAGKRTYTFFEGKILRKGLVIGHYDQDTREVSNLDPALPKQMRSIINGMLWRVERPKGNPLVEVFSREKEQSEFESKYPIPPPPPMDPKLGDKTPAYIQWFMKTHPDKFMTRYKGRKFDMHAEIKPPGDIPELPMDKPEEQWGPGV